MMTTELTTYDCATIRRQLAAELRVDIDRIRVRVRGRRQNYVWLMVAFDPATTASEPTAPADKETP